MAFLPMNAKEMRDRGWSEVDFVYVCGDSYVDHPSFGAAIITRVLEDCGYKPLNKCVKSLVFIGLFKFSCLTFALHLFFSLFYD